MASMSLFNKRYQKFERIVSCVSVGIKFVTLTQVGENLACWLALTNAHFDVFFRIGV